VTAEVATTPLAQRRYLTYVVNIYHALRARAKRVYRLLTNVYGSVISVRAAIELFVSGMRRCCPAA
jgi:hypothetical protein